MEIFCERNFKKTVWGGHRIWTCCNQGNRKTRAGKGERAVRERKTEQRIEKQGQKNSRTVEHKNKEIKEQVAMRDVEKSKRKEQKKKE